MAISDIFNIKEFKETITKLTKELDWYKSLETKNNIVADLNQEIQNKQKQLTDLDAKLEELTLAYERREKDQEKKEAIKRISEELRNREQSFVAIDFEHATSDKVSVCSIGIVSVEEGRIIDTCKYHTLIQPPNNEYADKCSKAHGITAADTKTAPTFLEVWPEICSRIKGYKLLAHGAKHTDSFCLNQAMTFNGITENLGIIKWIYTYDICKAQLNVICEENDIEIPDHHTGSNALACATIYLKHLKGELKTPGAKTRTKPKTGKTTRPFFELQDGYQKITGDVLKPDLDAVENKNNPFYGKKIVVSGTYTTWPNRTELCKIFKGYGADIDTSIGKYTNILCAGDKCGPVKVEKMQKLIDDGKDAIILTEDDILEIFEKHNM